MKQDIELKTVRLLIVSHSSKKLKKEIKLIKILYIINDSTLLFMSRCVFIETILLYLLL